MTSPPTATTRTGIKRGHAINGDLFEICHGSLGLDAPFTTFIDVSFRGTTHQVFSAADRYAFEHTTVTGEFTVAGHRGHILETLDAVRTQVSHRYQAIVTTEAGVLSTHSYADTATLLAFVGALRPAETRLGLVLNPDDECEYTTAPKVALDLAIGVVEVTPLTAEVIDLLPNWQGTAVAGGDLYGGRFTDDSTYLTLVTDTCRVVVMPGPDADADEVAELASSLEVDWHT